MSSAPKWKDYEEIIAPLGTTSVTLRFLVRPTPGGYSGAFLSVYHCKSVWICKDELQILFKFEACLPKRKSHLLVFIGSIKAGKSA